MMNHLMNNMEAISVGVVGLGLMGSSITTCMLIAGHQVVAVAPMPADLQTALPRIREHLSKSYQQSFLDQEPDVYLSNLTITQDYGLLKECQLVIECTMEDLDIKKSVYAKIEAAVPHETIITSNTSAIPIGILQRTTQFPDRFVGLHWMEPSHTTRFLEIICGDLTDPAKAEWLYALAHFWNKEPTLVRKDIRGFINNRLMYAMYREAFYLVENGYASVEDIDRACRNCAGYFMTFVGIFRWMDLTGVPAYHAVMQELFPTLNNQTQVPKLIDDVVKAGGKGVLNAKGFYDYTPQEAQLWKETYEEFSYEIHRLASKYPADLIAQKLVAQSKDEKNDK
jgi:3-hydroxybutyryl-CoA dehydrogenase